MAIRYFATNFGDSFSALASVHLRKPEFSLCDAIVCSWRAAGVAAIRDYVRLNAYTHVRAEL